MCSEREVNRRLGKEVISDDDRFTPGLTFYELIIRQVNWVIQRAFLFNNQQTEVVGPDPAIWIAGHSLGAALASLFFAHLLHVPEFPLTISKRVRFFWPLSMQLVFFFRDAILQLTLWRRH